MMAGKPSPAPIYHSVGINQPDRKEAPAKRHYPGEAALCGKDKPGRGEGAGL